MKVRDIETLSPEVISPDATLVECAKKMKQLDVGMLPVCDGERLRGAITDRDIAMRAVAEGWDTRIAKVVDCMTPNIVYCFEEQSIKEVAELMEEKQIRRLPVLNKEKRLVGIISLGDIAVRSGKEKLCGEILECVSEPAHSKMAMA